MLIITVTPTLLYTRCARLIGATGKRRSISVLVGVANGGVRWIRLLRIRLGQGCSGNLTIVFTPPSAFPRCIHAVLCALQVNHVLLLVLAQMELKLRRILDRLIQEKFVASTTPDEVEAESYAILAVNYMIDRLVDIH